MSSSQNPPSKQVQEICYYEFEITPPNPSIKMQLIYDFGE